MSSTDLYEIARAVRDTQSRMSSLDHKLSKLTGPSDPRPSGERFFKKATAFLLRSRNDHARADQVERSITGPALTTQAGWAAELATTTVGGLLLAISKQSAYAALAARTPSFAVGPDMQKVVLGGDITAGFVGEAQAIGVSQGVLATQTLVPRKLASLAVISEEIDERSAVNIETMLRRLMSAGIGTALDSVFFSNAAATSAAPAGILNGVSATPASAVTPASEAMRLDLQALIAALNAPTDPVFVVSPSRLVYATATLPAGFAYPMVASSALPPAQVVCVDAGALVAAHAPEPRFNVSADAAIHMDTAAGPISTVGTPNVVSAPTVSMFGQDLLALRTTLTITWAMRAGGVSFIDGVTW